VADINEVDRLRDAVSEADHVVHLAAIVGDPACSSEVDTAIQTNLYDTMELKRICSDEGISQFVFVSTCSVYGSSEEGELLTENSPTNPVSLYGRTKTMCEQSLIEEPGELSPTILRLATVHGLSNRPRFDLVVNYLTQKAVREGTGTIFGGDQWRPFIHTNDVARAFHRVLKADTDEVAGEVFNVGRDDENYTMKEIGEMVGELVPGAEISVDPNITDDRSYRVSFERIRTRLGFEPEITVRDGIREVREAVESGRIEDPDRWIYYNHQSGGKEAE
jgi:nucleoside-diphosphate-sugar epimerase